MLNFFSALSISTNNKPATNEEIELLTPIANESFTNYGSLLETFTLLKTSTNKDKEIKKIKPFSLFPIANGQIIAELPKSNSKQI